MKGGYVTETFTLRVYFLANDWYNPVLTGVSLRTEYRPVRIKLCTRTLAGNSSLWSVTPNASSLGENGRDEQGREQKSSQLFISLL